MKARKLIMSLVFNLVEKITNDQIENIDDKIKL